jgi:hypothetical protein
VVRTAERNDARLKLRNAAVAERRNLPLQVILAADELAAVRNFDIRLECPADRLRLENF